MANKQAIYAFTAACAINFVFVSGPKHSFISLPFLAVDFATLVVIEEIPCQSFRAFFYFILIFIISFHSFVIGLCMLSLDQFVDIILEEEMGGFYIPVN